MPVPFFLMPFNNGFLSTFVMEIYFLTFVDEANFGMCADKGKRIGFKLLIASTITGAPSSNPISL